MIGSGDDGNYVRILDLDFSSESWRQVGNNIYGEMAGDRFGNDVGISDDGSRVAVGARSNYERRWRVRIFQLKKTDEDSDGLRSR